MRLSQSFHLEGKRGHKQQHSALPKLRTYRETGTGMRLMEIMTHLLLTEWDLVVCLTPYVPPDYAALYTQSWTLSGIHRPVHSRQLTFWQRADENAPFHGQKE